jgi:hypothetical protein
MLTAVEKLKAARAEVVGAIAQLTEEVKSKLLELAEAVEAAEEVGVTVPEESRALAARVRKAAAAPEAPLAPQDATGGSTPPPAGVAGVGVGYTPAELREKVIAALRLGDTRAGQVATRIWGPTAMGVHIEAVHTAFAALKKAGTIQPTARGQYALVSPPADAGSPSPPDAGLVHHLDPTFVMVSTVAPENPQAAAGIHPQTFVETSAEVVGAAEKIVAIQAGDVLTEVARGKAPLQEISLPSPDAGPQAVDLNPEGFTPVETAEAEAPEEEPQAPVDSRPVGTHVALVATGATAPVSTYKRIVADTILPAGTSLSASSAHLNALNAATPVVPFVGDTVTVATAAGMVFRATVLP